MASRKTTRYKRVRVDHLEKKGGASLLAYFAVLIIIPVFVMGLLYVKLTSDQVKMKRELSRVRREFGLRSKELANLRVEEEMYRNGKRILSQVKEMGLKLQAPGRGQVIRVRRGRPIPGVPVSADKIVAGR